MARLRAFLDRLGPGLAGFAVLALLVVAALAVPAPFERARLQLFDAYQRAAPRVETQGSRVAIVDIDEESIVRLGQWPWPRTDLAQLTRRLGAAGATAVVFDIVFSEADRTSPDQIAAQYRQSGSGDVLDNALAGLPSHDSLLAQSFADVPVVTAFFLSRDGRGRAVEPKASFTLHGTLPTGHVASYDGSLQPLPAIEQAASGNGFVTLEEDADGIVRRVPLVAIHRGVLIPSLSVEALRVALDAGSPNLLASDGSGQGTTNTAAAVAVRLGGREIPVDDAGEMWVHFPRPGSQQLIPAWPIVTGAMSDADLAGQVRGRIVYIGGSATGLQDLVSTPVSDLIAGVTVHAAATSQMLAGDFLERPDWASGLELVLVLLLGIGLALVLPRLGAMKGAIVAVSGMATVAAGSWLAFTNAHLLIDPVFPVLAIALVYVVQTSVDFYREERQRSYIRSAFDRYLSPEMVRQIASDPGKLELGGEERDMSVLMCDIRGFSRISEQYSPREVIDFLIEFLTPMSDILMARRATLDKYIGDAVLAFWNAPLDDPDHHRNAARAALEMLATTAELNRTMPGKDGVVWPGEVKIGIGINSGLCCVGNMGSRQRLSYSLIGDTVNMTARLEGLTKQYGVGIITGSLLAAQLEGFALIEIDRVQVVGREAPETIYALLGDEVLQVSDGFTQLARRHAAILAAYRAQEWGQAEQGLKEAREDYARMGVSGLNAMFATRIAALRDKPPGAGWDGVFRATEK